MKLLLRSVVCSVHIGKSRNERPWVLAQWIKGNTIPDDEEYLDCMSATTQSNNVDQVSPHTSGKKTAAAHVATVKAASTSAILVEHNRGTSREYNLRRLEAWRLKQPNKEFPIRMEPMRLRRGYQVWHGSSVTIIQYRQSAKPKETVPLVSTRMTCGMVVSCS